MNPNEVCYVGDTREDMEAAINAKIDPIFIQRNPSSENELIDDYYKNKSPIIQNHREIDFKSVKRITSLKELTKLVN